MARRKHYDCDGCRRAFPGCSQICEATTNKESEDIDMTKLRIIPTAPLEVKNVLYPDRKPSMWKRITNMVASFFASL